VAADVISFNPGDKVYGMIGGVGGVQGSLAEYAAVGARLIAIKPTGWTFKEAAAAPLAIVTVWEGLVDRAHVGIGDTVLIQGGAGGVGHVAVQLAIAHGATVFATGTAAEAPTIRRFGATAIDYATRSTSTTTPVAKASTSSSIPWAEPHSTPRSPPSGAIPDAS